MPLKLSLYENWNAWHQKTKADTRNYCWNRSTITL